MPDTTIGSLLEEATVFIDQAGHALGKATVFALAEKRNYLAGALGGIEAILALAVDIIPEILSSENFFTAPDIAGVSQKVRQELANEEVA